MFTIHPYVSEWEGQRVWVFDDPSRGLINEGLVSGTDKFLDRMGSRFRNGDEGFTLIFSDQPMDNVQFTFKWLRTGPGEGLAEGVEGNWYTEEALGFEGWLCPALFKYFDTAPATIYVTTKAISGKLVRGTGKLVIQQDETVRVHVDVSQTVVWETTVEMPRSKWESLKKLPQKELEQAFGVLNGILDEPTGAMNYIVSEAKLVDDDDIDIEPTDGLF